MGSALGAANRILWIQRRQVTITKGMSSTQEKRMDHFSKDFREAATE
jgi:hypothetical protein